MFAGLSTYAHQLESYTDSRSDITAVHVHARWPFWAKLVGKAVPFLPPGWDQHQYRKLLAFRRVMNSWLAGLLSGRAFDAVYIMTQGIGLSSLDIREKYECPVILNLDATGESEVADFGYPRWTRSAFIGAERRMYAAANLIVGWSQWVADSLRSAYGVPHDKILVAPGAMLMTDAQLAASHVPEQRPVRIAFVGNDWPRKGGPRLLDWHQRRWRERAELHIFSKNAPANASAENVTWHRAVTRDVLLREHLPRMDLFVLPTREDTFVWAALEASAAGLPIVSSRLAGLCEVVEDGVTGLLCDRADDAGFIGAIESLLVDRSKRAAMGAAGRLRVASRFSPDSCFGPMIDRIVSLCRT